MVRMKRCAAGVLAAAVALLAHAQATVLRFAGVEIHGARRDRAELLHGVAMPPIGVRVAMDAAKIEAVCADVRDKLAGERFLHVGCAIVAHVEGDAYMVVDVVEPEDAERISYPVLQPLDHLKLAERGGERRSEELIACVRGCSQAADRGDALRFLGRFDWNKAICRATLQALDDRDRFVRREAAALLADHLASCRGPLGTARIVDAALRQIARPSHDDRTAAVDLMHRLARFAPDIDDERRRRVIAAADTLAARSVIPLSVGNARSLAGILRHPPGDTSPGPE